MGIYHKDLAHIPSVLTEHEVNFLALQRSLPFVKGPLKKLKDYYDSLQMMKRELDVLNQMDRVICMNRHDANALVGYVPQEKLEILPHGVDTAYFAPMADVAPEPNAIGYFGAFQHYPNVDAVHYFVHDIFPLVKERIPDAHFYVIGSNPPEEIRQLHGRTDITVTGFVPDIRPYMARCAVIVAPIRLGLGMRVKVVEAMAMGKPVVATELACEGIDVTDGVDAAMANTEESFAESVCYMLQDHACASAMGASARKLVERNFEYRAIGERLDRIYRSVTNR
jgi:glycosyltransferase involved in cell wall biosynthesis